MVTCAQYNNNYRNLHSLKVTATILTHLATHTTPTISGRQTIKPARLPGIRSLFTANAAQVVAAVLPPLQCAVGLISLGSPLASTEHQSLTTTPTKATVAGSPISPSMTPSSPLCQGIPSSAACHTISPKTRRPLSLHDLLSAETPTTPSTQHCKNVHHRRQCGIVDCHKYALTGGFCIRHGGGKRCNTEGCQTVAQSGGRCKAHGGGSKCKVSGCGSVARRKGFCMMHGGRQQCKIDGCIKCAHGGGFCISHGGGKRCSSKACNKSAQAGGFCYSHGGGKRCAAPECFQAARKGGLCIRHRKAATVLHRTLHPSLVRLTSVTGRSQHERRLSRLYYSPQCPDGPVAQDHGTNESPSSSVSPRRVGAGKPPPVAPLALWQIADSPLYWDENDGLSLLPESALEVETACQDPVLDKLRERRNLDVHEGDKEKEDVEQVEDSLNVDEISELFSSVEQEELSGVDFSVFIEDDDVVNVEKISQICSDLKSCSDDEEVTVSSPVDVVDTKQLEIQTQTAVETSLNFDHIAACEEQEVADTENVTMLSEILSATLEDKDTAGVTTNSAPTYSIADYEDAKRVDLVAELFTSLEESSGVDQEVRVADRSATCDWIDALEVDNVSSFFSELEKVEKMQMETQAEEAPSTGKVDSRVFVPKFSVRIEDLQRPGERRPAVGPNSRLLVGPPSVFTAGPPAPSRQERVGRWKSKRKAQPFSSKQPDPTISDTRRASAAKRQRVKGRFVSDTHNFVSITALQN